MGDGRTAAGRWRGRAADARRRGGAAALVLAIAVGLAGCGGDDDAAKKPAPEVRPPGERPAKVVLVFIAEPAINPDPAGRPSPVYFKLLELKATAAFDGADYAALERDAGKKLGGELKGEHEVMLRPGATLVRRVTPQPESRFLGVVAGFRDIEQARWRAVQAIPAQETTVLVIRVDRAQFTIGEE